MTVDYDYEDIYQPEDPYRDEHGFNYDVKHITHLDLLREALTLREFEVEHWTEYALIPWYLLRWIFALIWHGAFCLWLRFCWRIGRPTMVGRRTDPSPVICPRCLWAGPRRWLYHGYSPCGDDDVEPMDECPKCGSEL